MICWKHLTRMDKTMSAECIGGVPIAYSGVCGCRGNNNNSAARADRFMALVASAMVVLTQPSEIVNDARNTMSEIERRVEAGTIWEGK